MGSGASRHLVLPCLRPSAAGGDGGGAPDFEADEALGHSFCYVRSAGHSRSSSISDAAAFKSISGAAVSANSTAPQPLYNAGSRSHHPGFRSSGSFSSLPLQLSGPLDRGLFLSGPIERGSSGGGGFDSAAAAVPFSGPLKKRRGGRRRAASLLPRSLSERNRPWVVPLRSLPLGGARPAEREDDGAPQPAAGTVQWAHGKAGEDRIHAVVSEEHRWLFVGIYDGFNGPEAPEFLVNNLYRSVFNELRGLFWEEADDQAQAIEVEEPRIHKRLWEFLEEDAGSKMSSSRRFASKIRSGLGSWRKEGSQIWFSRWRYDSDERPKVAREAPGRGRRKAGPVADHGLVLSALSRALEATEIAYLEMTDRAMDCNPELALMGSCLLVVLMRDDDVYVMNLGDSRAIVAQHMPPQLDGVIEGVEIEMSGHESMLGALQLSTDHSTNIEEEVLRIKAEHRDDIHCIVNDRVKGRLKVTRAFGAGFLKQPKWNDGLLEMFRNDYIGTAPYISSSPALCHHKLGPNDQFLVLSSDGLYQYLNNEEVVLFVENFMEQFPDGDPAQSLIEEVLSRAAKKAGMDFHELLDIPQGDRRKYHDDVTVMVISLEGRIWKSSGKYL